MVGGSTGEAIGAVCRQFGVRNALTTGQAVCLTFDICRTFDQNDMTLNDMTLTDMTLNEMTLNDM